MSWSEPFVLHGEPQSWTFRTQDPWHTSGDGHTFMGLYVPNVRRASETYYVLLIERDKVQGRIEFHADDHETAKMQAIELARQYLLDLQVETQQILTDIQYS